MQQIDVPTIFDIYILKTSGIPLMTGCTMTDFCKARMKHHELQSGFFGALFSFSQELFADEHIQSIIFENFQINFLIDPFTEIMFIVVHPITAHVETIQRKLLEVKNAFLKRFPDIHQQKVVNQVIFDQFLPILKSINISKSPLYCVVT